MTHVIIHGNPVDGITIWGPFGDSEDAIEWATSDLHGDDWRQVEVQNPADARTPDPA